jgi:hypothetical protein
MGIGKRIRLLRQLGAYARGSEGVITGEAG